MVKKSCQCRRHGFDPWVGKIPWRRAWQPTPVFLPGKRSRACCIQSMDLQRVGHTVYQLNNNKNILSIGGPEIWDFFDLWPGEFHGLYSPWGCKETDNTEQLSLSLSLSLILVSPSTNIGTEQFHMMTNDLLCHK